MNNIMKLLTVSAISCAVIANSEATNAQAACVKPVQGFVSLGLFGSQSKIKGDVNLSKLKGYTNDAVLKEIGSKYLNDEEFKKIFKSEIKVEPGTQTSTGLKDGKIGLYAKDDVSNNTVWIKNSDVINPSLKVEQSGDNNNKVINITSTTDFLGNHSVVPVGTKYDSNLETQVSAKTGDNFTSTEQAVDDKGNPISVYDKDHPAPTINQQIKVYTESGQNPGNLYQVTLNSDDSSSSNNSWFTRGWQLSGYANVGLLVNLPLGGSWYLSFFGMKPFVNSNQNISLGNTDNSSSDDKNKSGFNIKNKGTLGFETGLRCSVSDKVWLGFGGGVQRSWYGVSLNSSSNDSDSKNNSNSEVQNMKGDAFFAKFSLGFNVTNNVGVETFVKYTAKHNLKTGTSKKKSDSNDNNSSEFPMDFTNPGALSFGVACTFTF